MALYARTRKSLSDRYASCIIISMNNDLNLLGLFFGIAGTFLWAKSVMFKRKSQLLEEAHSYYGHNTPKVKSDLIQQYETGIGVLLIGIGFIIQITSIYAQIYFSSVASIFPNEVFRTISLFLLLIVLVFTGMKISYKIGFRGFYRTIKKSMLDAYNIYIFIINHNGVNEEHYSKGTVLTDEYKTENLRSAKEHLLTICEWMDVKRIEGENEEQFFARLGNRLR